MLPAFFCPRSPHGAHMQTRRRVAQCSEEEISFFFFFLTENYVTKHKHAHAELNPNKFFSRPSYLFKVTKRKDG